MNQITLPGSEELARAIEHSTLAPDTTRERIIHECSVARAFQVRAMVVQPVWLDTARKELAWCDVIPVSVLAFPHGGALAETKAAEAAELASRGAGEIDMVMNIGALKSGSPEEIAREIAMVVAAARGVAVKVILETCLLTDEEIVASCRLCEKSGARFVKTSTGFSGGGATEAAVRLMRSSVGTNVGVKASGGIRTREDALRMLRAGADRIGTSATAKILGEEARA